MTDEELQNLPKQFLTEFPLATQSGAKLVYTMLRNGGMFYGIATYNPATGEIKDNNFLACHEYTALLKFHELERITDLGYEISTVSASLEKLMDGMEIHDVEN